MIFRMLKDCRWYVRTTVKLLWFVYAIKINNRTLQNAYMGKWKKYTVYIGNFTRMSRDRVSNICTWCYIAAQMIQRLSDIFVTLNVIKIVIRTPSWVPVLQNLNEYVVKRTTSTLNVCTASVPRTTMKWKYSTARVYECCTMHMTLFICS